MRAGLEPPPAHGWAAPARAAITAGGAERMQGAKGDDCSPLLKIARTLRRTAPLGVVPPDVAPRLFKFRSGSGANFPSTGCESGRAPIAGRTSDSHRSADKKRGENQLRCTGARPIRREDFGSRLDR